MDQTSQPQTPPIPAINPVPGIKPTSSAVQPAVSPKSSGGGSSILVILLVVILAGVIGLGGWYFFIREEDKDKDDDDTEQREDDREDAEDDEDEDSAKGIDTDTLLEITGAPDEESARKLLEELGLGDLTEEELLNMTDEELEAIIEEYFAGIAEAIENGEDFSDEEWFNYGSDGLQAKLDEALANAYDSDEIAVAGITKWELVDVHDYGASLSSVAADLNEAGCESENGRFVVITFEVTNTGDNAVTLMGVDLEGKSSGDTYTTTDANTTLCEMDETISFLEALDAGETTDVSYVYDMPTDSDYYAIFSDFNFMGEGWDTAIESLEQYAYMDLSDVL